MRSAIVSVRVATVRKISAFSLSDHVLRVLIVLVANGLQNLLTRGTFGNSSDCPRPRISARVVNSRFDLQMAQIGSPEALRDVQLLAMLVAQTAPGRPRLAAAKVHRAARPARRPAAHSG